MIQLNITVWREKGLSTADEDELVETIADFMGVEYGDVELVWEFEEDEG